MPRSGELHPHPARPGFRGPGRLLVPPAGHVRGRGARGGVRGRPRPDRDGGEAGRVLVPAAVRRGAAPGLVRVLAARVDRAAVGNPGMQRTGASPGRTAARQEARGTTTWDERQLLCKVLRLHVRWDLHGCSSLYS